MAPVAAPAWRLSVTTVGAAEMRFVVPCGDGDITVLELTRRLMERCQSLMPDVPLLADRLVDERDGSMLFPEDKAREEANAMNALELSIRSVGALIAHLEPFAMKAAGRPPATRSKSRLSERMSTGGRSARSAR